jgi:hypothetical protein
MKNRDLYNQLLTKLQKKYPNKTLEELDVIVRYPFKFVVKMINEDKFHKPILINKFGTFTSTPERREKIIDIVKEKANAKASGVCESLEY